jgi:hypothetical protein
MAGLYRLSEARVVEILGLAAEGGPARRHCGSLAGRETRSHIQASGPVMEMQPTLSLVDTLALSSHALFGSEQMKEEIDEARYSSGIDYLFGGRYGSRPVLREQGAERERQGASRRRQDELRKEVQAGRLRKQSRERGRQAASRCGQE